MLAQKDVHNLRPTLPALILCALALTGHAHADDARKPGWSSTSRVSLVDARGASDALTAGLHVAVQRAWPRAELAITMGGLLVTSSTQERHAIGTPEDFEVVARDERATGARETSFGLELTSRLSDRLVLVTSADWERNETAGVSGRTVFNAGFGFAERAENQRSMRATLGLTWTEEDTLVDDDAADAEFPGLRFGWIYGRSLDTIGRYDTSWTLDGNIDDLDDFRSDWVQTLTISINTWLSFELEVRWRHDSRPALEAIDLVPVDGMSRGETVSVELGKDETQLTMGLVFQR